MLYIAVIIFFLIFIWGIMFYIRKSLWDVVHRNLLDLEDKYGGNVIRRGLVSRPVYHAKISGYDLTINFSADKLEGERVNYINISYGALSSFSFTLANWSWLKKQESENPEDFKEFLSDKEVEFILRPISLLQVKEFSQSQIFNELINNLENLSYLFVGQSGIICEFSSELLANDCKLEEMEKKIVLLTKLGKYLNDRKST